MAPDPVALTAFAAADWEAETLAKHQRAALSPPPPPGAPPNDPADRIIVATARAEGATVMTRDRALLAHAEAGHVTAVAC